MIPIRDAFDAWLLEKGIDYRVPGWSWTRWWSSTDALDEMAAYAACACGTLPCRVAWGPRGGITTAAWIDEDDALDASRVVLTVRSASLLTALVYAVLDMRGPHAATRRTALLLALRADEVPSESYPARLLGNKTPRSRKTREWIQALDLAAADAHDYSQEG